MKLHVVSDLLQCAAHRWPDKPALIDGHSRLTYRELLDAASRVSDRLAESGVTAGDRVLCSGESNSAMAATLLGVLERGAVIVPVHPETPRAAAERLVNDAAPRALCLGASAVSSFGSVGGVSVLPIPETDELLGERQPFSPHGRALMLGGSSPDATAALMYTSGSTGPPRAVICPHAAVLFAVQAIASVLRYQTDDVVLGNLPFSFDYGLYQIFLSLASGATLVLADGGAHVHLLPRLLREHRITVLPANPSMVAMLLRTGFLNRVGFPDLRLITSTGEVLPEPHIQRLSDAFPHARIAPMYGLTECKRVSICSPYVSSRPAGTVGIPLPGTAVRVTDATGADLPTGDVGELVVRGPHLMAGYWNAPTETADRFRLGPLGELELWTHDLFRQDSDGFLYFVGRNQSVIKSLGHRVGPSEVEQVILTLPSVVETAVVGITDPIRGEAIVAFVVVHSATTAEELQAHCRLHLLPAACPIRFVVLETALPRTRNGKVDRELLRATAARPDPVDA